MTDFGGTATTDLATLKAALPVHGIIAELHDAGIPGAVQRLLAMHRRKPGPTAQSHTMGPRDQQRAA